MCCNVMDVCLGAPRVLLQAASGALVVVPMPASRSRCLPTVGLPRECALTMESADCPCPCLPRVENSPIGAPTLSLEPVQCLSGASQEKPELHRYYGAL